MRVVLDTNAVVSALLFSGISSKLVSLWQKGLITLRFRGKSWTSTWACLPIQNLNFRREIKELIQEEIPPYAEVIKPKGACASPRATRQTTSLSNARLQEKHA